LTAVQKKQVKKLIKGAGEIKRVSWYNTYNDGTSTSRANGLISNWGYANQNNIISVNNTDALRIVPSIGLGTDDFNRIGDRVQVASMKVHGAIRVSLQTLAEWKPTDIRVVIYVLSSKLYKDYNTLYSQNNFNQLLDVNDGTTQRFNGTPLNEFMRVADQYYTVHKKKVITLRFAGFDASSAAGTASVANSHNYYATFNMDLTKILPKVLKFPESGGGTPAEFINAPTNAAPFLAFGFVNQKGGSNFVDATVATLQQTYITNLNFRDV